MNEFVSISELTQRRKDKINSKNIAERFIVSLIDSSVMLQIAERVRTLRTLIDRRCGIVGGLKNVSRTNSRGGGLNISEGWKKVKILIAKGRVGFSIVFFSFLIIKNTVLRIFVYTVRVK